MVTTPPLPYKMAVVGLAFKADGDMDAKRSEIEEAVRSALEALPWVQVHATYFMWNDVEINVTAVKINGQEALDGQ